VNGHLAIHARLNGAAGLAALVKDRIYPDVMPDSPIYPAVTYQQLSGSSARGAVADPPLKKALFQVSTWAKSRLDAVTIAAQVRMALDRLRKAQAGGVQVDDCFFDSSVDAFDPDTKTYAVHTTFRLHYREAA
jgi:hypothetical protein